MKRCHYCGSENDCLSLSCVECGTSLPASGEVESDNSVERLRLTAKELRLDAGRSTIFLLGYLGAQFATGSIAGIFGVILAGIEGKDLQNPQMVAALKQTVITFALVPAAIAGGLTVLWMSRSVLREHLRDRGPTGAAWVVGSWRTITHGLCIGLLAGLCFYLLALAVAPLVRTVNPGPIARMAITPGLPRLLWAVMLLVLAPPIEELLFRGVLYGGYCRSYGSFRAATLTTAIFVILHISEIIGYWPAMLGITGLALAALWLRLRWAAIGPAIAVHFGYNLVIVLAMFYLRR